jgi:hypothetical protein
LVHSLAIGKTYQYWWIGSFAKSQDKLRALNKERGIIRDKR